jgi:hypothetical protein
MSDVSSHQNDCTIWNSHIYTFCYKNYSFVSSETICGTIVTVIVSRVAEYDLLLLFIIDKPLRLTSVSAGLPTSFKNQNLQS